MAHSTPDLRLLDDVVTPRVLAAMRTASRTLASLGVRHAVAGGLVTLRPGVPIQIGGVAVDLLATSGDDAFLEDSLAPAAEGEVPVTPAGVLVYLKLKSPRLKDRADVVELVKAGLAVEDVRLYLERHAPPLVAELDKCITQARAEED
jgi:hypothetical protein